MDSEEKEPKLSYESKTALKIVIAMLALLVAFCVAMPGSAFAYTQKEQIVNNGHGTLYNENYLVVHETANPGAPAKNHVNYWKTSDYAVHYVMELDGSVVYHTMSDDRKAWHIGNGNSRAVGIELCHATSKSDFDKQWNEAIKWCGDYLHKRGWNVSHMISHNEARLMWGGTDHTDPLSYFSKYGKSWSQFEQAVSTYMATGKVSGNAGQTSGGTSTAATNSSSFGGTYTCMVDALNIRTSPSTSAGVVGQYHRGQTVNLDGWYTIHDGYVWGRYTAYSGNIRYIAVGKPTGGVSADDYLIKGGRVSGGSSATVSGAGWYDVTARAGLNVRTGPSTGYARTGTLPYGYDLYVNSISNGWAAYTTYSGATRYVSAQYLAA